MPLILKLCESHDVATVFSKVQTPLKELYVSSGSAQPLGLCSEFRYQFWHLFVARAPHITVYPNRLSSLGKKKRNLPCMISPERFFFFLFFFVSGKHQKPFFFTFYKYTEEACNATSAGCNTGAQVCTFLCNWSCDGRTFHFTSIIYYDPCIIFKRNTPSFLQYDFHC